MERADLYGKPHIGDAFYPDRRTKLGHLEPGAMCALCGRPASNAHHIVPKGMGGGSATLYLPYDSHGIILRSPLMAVCGMGNASGCHKALHDGRIKVRWVWDEERFAEWWWKGHFFENHEPHDPMLFCFGHYVIERDGGEVEFRG
ncbi:MAG: hypothetical protein IJR41_04735 [Atopobiaceae bacterium]|nr:hypothetical protein [Atopobiaceae bacterium]